MATRGTADRGAPPTPATGTGSLSADGARQVSRERSQSPGRIVAIAAGALVVALIVVAAATGTAAVAIAAGALVAIVAVFALIYGIGARRVTARDAAAQPDAESRQAALREPMPGAALMESDETDLGDTAEAHDEINPRDLPPDHPGRQAAEEQAQEPAGTSRGDAELNEAAPARRREGEPGG